VRVFSTLIISVLIFTLPGNAFSMAADCSKTCIDLTVENGELVITGKRTPLKLKHTPRPAPKFTAIPTTKPTPKPNRKITRQVKPKPRTPA
jgi:hypothetical protein